MKMIWLRLCLLALFGPFKPPAAWADASTAATPSVATTITATQYRARLSGTPTLGDWEDLTQQKAYQEQLFKLQSGAASPSTQSTVVQPTPLPPSVPLSAADLKPNKKGRVSEACRDDDSPCFFSVYGLSLDEGNNNYRGLLAIDGLVVNVHKGRQFRTRHNRYTVTRISTHELTAVDQAGRTHVWPYAGSADIAAEPEELSPIRPHFTPPPSNLYPFSVPQR